MRSPPLLAALLLLTVPGALLPAQGAPVVNDLCLDGLCPAAETCTVICGDVQRCTPEDPATGTRSCGVISPCQQPGSSSRMPPPTDCVPGRRPLGWDACSGGRTEFSLRIFTGRGSGGTGSASGTMDPLWRAVAYPPSDWQAPTLAGPAYSRGVSPISAWVSDPASSWINPYPASNHGPGGQYVLQATYFVPFDAYGVTLSGRYAADNSALVSDTDVLLSRLVDTSGQDAFGSWTHIPATPLGTGHHTLDVNVHNRHAQSPVGANVQFTVHGYCKPKGPTLGLDACSNGARSFRIVLNTGIDPSGTPLPSGAVDPHWTAGAGGPAYSLGVNPLPGTWVSDPSSAWIGATAPAGARPPGTTGQFGYQVNYFLPSNAYNVVVGGKAAADNAAILADTDTFQSTFVAQTPDPYGFSSWTSFSYAVGTLGYHVFSASVVNHGGPSGLNVVAQVTGLCRQPVDTEGDIGNLLGPA